MTKFQTLEISASENHDPATITWSPELPLAFTVRSNGTTREVPFTFLEAPVMLGISRRRYDLVVGQKGFYVTVSDGSFTASFSMDKLGPMMAKASKQMDAAILKIVNDWAGPR